LTDKIVLVVGEAQDAEVQEAITKKWPTERACPEIWRAKASELRSLPADGPFDLVVLGCGHGLSSIDDEGFFQHPSGSGPRFSIVNTIFVNDAAVPPGWNI